MPIPFGLLPLLSPLIAEVAPGLVRMATGSDSAGRVAGAILPEIGRATGLPVSSAGEVSAAIRALKEDPAAFERVAAEIRAVEAQELEALLLDRQDARARDLEIRRMNGGANREATLLMVAIFALMVGAYAAMIFAPGLSAPAEAALSALANGLLPIIAAIAAFYWGSSRGSKAKDAELAGIASGRPRASPDVGMPILPRAGRMEPVVEPGDRRGGGLR